MMVMVAMEKIWKYYKESIIVFYWILELSMREQKIKTLILSRGDEDNYDNINRNWGPWDEETG